MVARKKIETNLNDDKTFTKIAGSTPNDRVASGNLQE
jgi:hypothetical protein